MEALAQLEFERILKQNQRGFFSKFRQNRLSFYSFLILASLFFFSLIFNFISNDKPLLVKYQGDFYFPIFKEYSEKFFGGDFETEADYLDPALQIFIKKDGFLLMPPFHYSYDSINLHLNTPPPTPPSFENPLGTDGQARDVFARLIYGIRSSLLFGLILTFFSSIIGIFLGAIQGYYAGKLDLILQRMIEIWTSLPVIFIFVIISSFFQPDFFWLILIMTFFSWNQLVTPVRAEFLKIRNLEFVLAAKAAGISDTRIIFKHILPNALVSILSFIPFILAGSITILVSLDFLGFGLAADQASLGEMIAQTRSNPQAIWLGFTSFFSLTLILSLIIFTSEGIRDALALE